MAMPPDPYTSTREAWTQALVDVPAPPSPPVKQAWVNNLTAIQKLLNLLAHHEAMAPNLQQTYMTPAASKNKIYFMWDFWGRTLGMLMQVDPTLRNGGGAAWREFKTRVTYGLTFMSDENGTADRMNAAAHPGAYEIKAFGSEVLAACKDVRSALQS